MYYHMYGATTNTLTVRTQKGNNAAIDRWQRAGDHGNAWHRLSGLSLPLDPDTKVTFGYQNIIHISHGFEGDIPEYQPRGDTKALARYVTRCRRQRVT